MIASMDVLAGPREIPGANLLNLLVVDDERAVREGCRDAAQSAGFNTFVADSAEHAYKVLDTQNSDIVLLDLKLPGASGLEALRTVKSRRPNAVVVIITGYATVSSAVQAMKMGAFDYISKPFTLDELRIMLERSMDELKMTTEKRVLRERLRSKHGFGSIIGRSPEMEKLYRIIAKAAQSTHPVLIMGESGTGKELVARCIHYSGPYHDKPFIPVDCGSLVPTLIESELFGYVRGAFTGAIRAKEGLLAIASGGTVFLDEIGELTVDLQAKLLRAIQEKEIRPVGSTKRVNINVRILAATNRNLEAAVADGTFRRDLYFRLNGNAGGCAGGRGSGELSPACFGSNGTNPIFPAAEFDSSVKLSAGYLGSAKRGSSLIECTSSPSLRQSLSECDRASRGSSGSEVTKFGALPSGFQYKL